MTIVRLIYIERVAKFITSSSTIRNLSCLLVLLSFGIMQEITAQVLFQLEKLDNKINTPYHDEITPVLSRDGRTLCFTRVGHPLFDKTLMENGLDISKYQSPSNYTKTLKTIYSKIAGYDIDNPEASSFNQDIWIAKTFGEEFSIVSHPPYPLNNALPNSVSAIPPNEQSLIVLNQFFPDGGMRKGFSISDKLPNGNWSFPHPMFIDEYSNIGTDVGLTMSNDGNIIILTMNSGDSYGSNDLYVSFRRDAYNWSKPVNIGPIINSSHRETTPFLTVDNQTLYFSSNRPGSYGGNDIYYSKRLDNTWENWSSPALMPEPINSKFDDSQPYYNTLNGFLYFSSKRDGSSDIFRVRIEKPVKETVTIVGTIYNPKTEELIEDVTIRRSYPNSEYSEEVYYSKDGTYEIELPKGAEYDLIADKAGHIGEKESMEFKKSYLYFKDYRVDLVLRPIEAGTKLNLKAIYFERSTSNILEKSYPALDELAVYLKENKQYYVRIVGHTDNQGKADELKALSESRAEAIKEYLVYKKRVKPVRLDTEGMGGTEPVTDNSTEELRAENRRVEAIIMTVSRIIEEPITRN